MNLTAIKYGIIALTFLAQAFFFYTAGKNSCQVKETKQVKADVIQGNDAAQSLEDKKHEREVVYKEVTKYVDRIVDRPIYRADCVDADGLLVINSALQGSAPAKPDAAMPKP